MIPDVHPVSIGPLVLKTTFPDVGHLATWTVSSHKPGFDVNCLRDDDPETFWQSDGPQPHYITLQFAKKVPVQKLAIMLNFSADDSYTPVKLLIKAGTGLYDLQDVKTITMDKPTGWISFDVGTERAKDGHGLYQAVKHICTSGCHSREPHEWQRYTCTRTPGSWCQRSGYAR